MSQAETIRKTMEILKEATSPDKKGVDANKDVRVSIQTLSREYPSSGRYEFNKGFLAFQDILDDPKASIARVKTTADVKPLVGALDGIKKDPRYTDKEAYLRQGYEARGFSSPRTILIWYKDSKTESLFIFASSKQEHMEVRDFLRKLSIIR